MVDYATARLEVWLYNADPSTGYRILPMAGSNSPGVASGTTGRTTVDSGYAEATLMLFGSKADFPDLVPRRRVEFYACYTSRFTGLLRRDLLHQADIDRVLPLKNDNRYLKVTLIGLWSEAGQKQCLKRYALPQVSDKSVVFADLAARFVATGRLADVQVQVLPIGADIMAFDAYGSDGVGVPFSRAASNLAQDVGQVAIGADVSPSGRRRLFFRPFDDPTKPARHTLTAPSRRIGQTSDEDDVSGQATVLSIVGGKAYYPNLLAAAVSGNTTFNDPQVPGDSDAANLVTNPSFEAGDEGGPTGWSAHSGASFKETEENVAAFNGKRYLELDHVGEYAENRINTFSVAQPAGTTLTLDARARVSSESKLASGEVDIVWLNSSGAGIGNATLSLVPQDTTWALFQTGVVVPAGTVGVYIKPICTAKAAGDASYALLVDEIRLYDASAVVQRGWEIAAFGDAVVNQVRWYDESTVWKGGGSVYLDVSSSNTDGQDIHLQPIMFGRYSVTGGQSITSGFIAKKAPGSPDIPIFVEEWEYESDGSISGQIRAGQTISSTEWTVYPCRKNFGEGGTEGISFLTIRGSGKFWIGGAFAFDVNRIKENGGTAAGGEGVGQAAIVDVTRPDRFTEGDKFVTTVRADALFASGDPVHDAAAALGDIFAQEQHSEIVAQADADTYGAAFFAKNVPVLSRINLDSFGVIETGDPDPVTGIAPSTATMMPGESIRLLGDDGASLMPSPLPLYEKEWTWAGGLLTIKPHIQAAPRDPSRTLVGFIRKLQAQGIIPSASSS